MNNYYFVQDQLAVGTCGLHVFLIGFVGKCIQLYETTIVRHGLMLVGPTISGKTKVCTTTALPVQTVCVYLVVCVLQCYEVLRDAVTALKGKCTAGGTPFETVLTHVLNPKSITMGQLYGEFDALTHEW